MFTLTVQDEQVFKRLTEKVWERGDSLDEVLREMLDHEETMQSEKETPAARLLRLIDATEFPFVESLDARDAGELIRREAGGVSWHK